MRSSGGRFEVECEEYKYNNISVLYDLINVMLPRPANHQISVVGWPGLSVGVDRAAFVLAARRLVPYWGRFASPLGVAMQSRSRRPSALACGLIFARGVAGVELA